MDLSKCFDTLNHYIIIERFRAKVTDGSVLSLRRQFLESGVMIREEYEPTDTGSPPGGVISPLIANVYLDKFDGEVTPFLSICTKIKVKVPLDYSLSPNVTRR